jgi:hypothetical protein
MLVDLMAVTMVVTMVGSMVGMTVAMMDSSTVEMMDDLKVD